MKVGGLRLGGWRLEVNPGGFVAGDEGCRCEGHKEAMTVVSLVEKYVKFTDRKFREVVHWYSEMCNEKNKQKTVELLYPL